MGAEKRRVLLVDDEIAIIKVVSKRLELDGFDVLTAMDGQEGLVKARLEHPDAIILDLMMPKMSGVEVCAALKKDPRCREIPVLILTGKGSEADERRCRELGVFAYLRKPHDGHALIQHLNAILGPAASQDPPSDPRPETSSGS